MKLLLNKSKYKEAIWE